MQNSFIKRNWVGLSLALLAILSGALMLFAAKTDSAIMDELAHIPAGYGYVHEGDYRLNPEHPPLLKAIAALPLLVADPVFPISDPAWTSEINGQWAMGAKFLYGAGNDADNIVFLARLGPILLTLLAGLLVFKIAKKLYGKKWALLPTALFLLSPSVLAHGHYVTTDVAAAFGILLSLFYFYRFLIEPSLKTVALAGLALGVAQVLKFSAVLLLPFYAGMIIIVGLAAFYKQNDLFAGKLKAFFLELVKKGLGFVAVLAVGYAVVVYPIYFVFTKNYPVAKQASDTSFILGSFSGGPTPAGERCKLLRCPADLVIAMSKSEALRPLAEYSLGVLMVTQRSSGGNTSYFLNEISAAGSRGYFPTVFALKETIPTLILILCAIAVMLAGFFRSAKKGEYFWHKTFAYLEHNLLAVSFALFILFYWFMSVRSPLNIGFRHLFPTLPLLYILITGAWKHLAENGKFWKFALAALLLWFGAETALAAPYFLSYFNEIGGGTSGGYRFVTDSNYDWGQDLLRLKEWAAIHPEATKIAVDYFGGGSPEYELPGRAVGWNSAMGDPRSAGIHYLAVSVNTLESAIAKTAPGFTRGAQDEYAWLQASKAIQPGFGGVPVPDYRVGTSIFVYRLD